MLTLHQHLGSPLFVSPLPILNFPFGFLSRLFMLRKKELPKLGQIASSNPHLIQLFAKKLKPVHFKLQAFRLFKEKKAF